MLRVMFTKIPTKHLTTFLFLVGGLILPTIVLAADAATGGAASGGTGASAASGTSAAASAVTTGAVPTAQSMLANIATQVPNLMRLTTALAYVMGMGFIVAGIVKMKHFGEMRTMMSQEHGMFAPMVFIAVGAALLYLPTSVQVGMSTFWNNPSPMAYTSQADQWNQFLSDCYMIIELIGVIAFIRGLVMLSHGGRGGQSSIGKGLTHVVAGIFCINIYQFVQMVLSTLGIGL